jgi:hypothetical protein
MKRSSVKEEETHLRCLPIPDMEFACAVSAHEEFGVGAKADLAGIADIGVTTEGLFHLLHLSTREMSSLREERGDLIATLVDDDGVIH